MKYRIATFVILGMLAACGGGGSGSGDNSSNATALCADGTVTQSAGTQGACSGHGGLASSNTASTATPTAPTVGGGGVAATQNLQVVAKVNGVVASGYPVIAASAPAIILSSGQELEVTSSIPTVFGGNLNGAVGAVRTNTSTTYKAVLAATSDTTSTLTFTTTSVPLQTITIPVTVKAAQFQPVVPKVGDSYVYIENDTLVNKSAFRVDNMAQRVTTVNADGSWAETYLTSANVPIGTATYTSQGNRTSFRNDASSTQTCNSIGNKLSRYTPEQKLLAFPISVGSTFTGTWKATCGTDTTVVDSQDESIDARVIGYESVTTAAGVFIALRIDEVTTVTNSTNAAFPGGGYSQTVSVWFDPVLGRNIKFSGVRSYNGTLSTSQAALLIQSTNIELVSYVKN